MYDLDFLTCSMTDVINRSVVFHPSLLRDMMLAAAKTHWDYSNVAANKVAAGIALDMASNLRRMADELDMNDFDPEALELGERVQAFGIASKLHCLSPSLARDIAARG